MVGNKKYLSEKLEKSAKLNEAYKKVFDSKDGELVLTDLCKKGFILDTTYVPNNAHETSHREGMRRLILSILRFLNKRPEDILQMLKLQQEDNE